MESQTGKSERERPRQALGSSHSLTFQANPTSNVQVKRPVKQGTASTIQRPFTFQAGPTPMFAPPTQPFTFQAGPTYQTPVLSSGFSPTNTRTESPTNADYDNDQVKLDHLEDEVADLQKQRSGLQRKVQLLPRQKDEQDRGRSSRLPPATLSPPQIDYRAEFRRLRRQQEFQEAAAQQAHNDAKRIEVEVKRQAIRDKIEEKRKDWWDKNKERQTSPPHNPFPVSPATIAAPKTSFTTTLAYRPASRPPQPSRIPLPSRAPYRPRSSQRDNMENAVRSRIRTSPEGILWNPDENLWIPPKPLKLVRFNKVIHYREDNGNQDDDEEQAKNKSKN